MLVTTGIQDQLALQDGPLADLLQPTSAAVVPLHLMSYPLPPNNNMPTGEPAYAPLFNAPRPLARPAPIPQTWTAPPPAAVDDFLPPPWRETHVTGWNWAPRQPQVYGPPPQQQQEQQEAPRTPPTGTHVPIFTPPAAEEPANVPVPTANDMATLQWQARAMMIEEIAFGPPRGQPQPRMENPTGQVLEAIPAVAQLGTLQQSIYERQVDHARTALGNTEAAGFQPRPWQAVLNQGTEGWNHSGIPTGTPVHGAALQIDALHALQTRQNATLAEERAQRRQHAAQLMAGNYMRDVSTNTQHVPEEQDIFGDVGDEQCCICLESFEVGERIRQLSCAHKFHADCINEYEFALEQRNRVQRRRMQPTEDEIPMRCPYCRREPIEERDEIFIYGYDGGYETPSSHAGSYHPWWPVGEDGEFCYHSTTQLEDGRISWIIDPGAWTNLVGSMLARRATAKALESGYNPKQERMVKPLQVAGVGNGSQEANFRIRLPVAISTTQGSELHEITSPIVEGSGANLPGLLGLDSLKRNRALLDMDSNKLIFPGPGEITYELPPGSKVIPLVTAPSGHLVLVTDAYGELSEEQGGVVDSKLTLWAQDPTETSARSSGDASPVTPQ